MSDLNDKYRAEGWGKLAEEALGVQPSEVEVAARNVARHASSLLEAKEIVIRHERLALALEHIARCQAEYNLASLRLQKARLELEMLRYENETGVGLFPLHAEGFKRWCTNQSTRATDE